MRKEIVVIGTMILAATLLAIKGQSIAYFVTDYTFVSSTIHVLLVITFVSISLFVLSFIIGMIYLAQSRIQPNVYVVLLMINIFFGVIVSYWSLFILAMWWG